MKFVLDKTVKKIYNLNQLKIGDTLTGIPQAEFYENKKGNKFIKLGLDYGHAICRIFFLIFDFPMQKVLNSYIYNSFELVKFYREANGILIDEDITMLHDINWQEIIDWINQKEIMKIRVINKNINGFRNIRFLKTENYI